jgi:hypothetical protein
VRPFNTRVWIFGVIAVACALFAGWNLLLIWFHPEGAPCTLTGHPADHGNVDRAWFAIGAPVAVVLGRIVSRSLGVPPFYRQAFRVDARAQVQGPPEPQPNTVRAGQVAETWVQLLIVILLTAALVGLGYETIGVAHDNNPWPLTYLVRCLNEGSATHWTSAWTLLVTWTVAFIIGNWFWPESPAGPGSSGGSLNAG